MVLRILSEIGLFRMSRDYSKSPEFLSTLERGLAVLKSFAGQAKSMTLSQVAERTALSPAVVRRCLLTLEHLGYVSKMDGRFALSPGVLSFASLFNEAYNLDGTIRPILQRLRDETGDSASFTVMQNADVLYVSHSSAQRAIRLQANTGTRYPALVTSTGRAMLADLSDEDLHEFIETAQSNLDCSVLQSIPDQTILLGVLDLSTHEVETPQMVVERVERALPYINKERVVLAPDCGLKYLPRDVSRRKLDAMVAGASLLRARHS